jgi:hypothetical protein
MRNILADPPIEDVFARSFSVWIKNRPNKPTGFLPVLARDYCVSVSQLRNVLSGRRKTNEGWRRLVARKIGLSYESMIGLPPQFNIPTGHKLIVHVNSQTGKNPLNNICEFQTIHLYESSRLAIEADGPVFSPYENPTSTMIVYKPELQGHAKHDQRALRVGDDTMKSTIVQWAIIVVDLEDKEYPERIIFVVRVTDMIAAVKRVGKWEKGFFLLCDNPDFVPEPIELDWNELCVGRVIRQWKDTRQS